MRTRLGLHAFCPAAGVALVLAFAACSPPIDHVQESMDPTGWRMAGSGRDEMRQRGDATVLHEGRPTLRLAAVADSSEGYGTWMNVLFASPYVGKRVRISVYTRTAGATRRADVWARVQARESPADGVGLVGKNVALPASSDWRRTEIVFDVPRDAVWVHYGVGLAGAGQLWMDRATIEVVGRDVPLTAELPGSVVSGS
ncbi:MAG: hypothetical protein K2Y26_07395 [Gemmatimonadaceae bacterium]|nr:hypothetical protein [Gemmatimonadaceae bacterium]